jgi:hypothetical protein
MTKERLAYIERWNEQAGERTRDEVREVFAALRERDERIAKLREAVERCANHLGCGDNSCVFVKPTGMATNGGCRCIEHARPGVHPSLGYLFRVAKETVSE